MTGLSVLILAAGQGTRMRSHRPKVLHHLAYRPLLQHLLDAVRDLNPQTVYVVSGHQAQQVEAAFVHEEITWVRQEEQKGTGHAVQCALPALEGFCGEVLILAGDLPLIRSDILKEFITFHHQGGQGLTVLSTHLDNPKGYGRIVRQPDGKVVAIVEDRDADEKTREIREINSGIYLASMEGLPQWLSALNRNNSQGEYYLPDIVPLALAAGGVQVCCHADHVALGGINDREQLALAEVVFRDRLVKRLMVEGVTFVDPTSCWLAADVRMGRDTIIAPNVLCGPGVEIGEGCQIGPFCHITRSRVGPGVQIEPFCHLDGADIAGDNVIGPYARLRPGTVLDREAKVGNFCEIKKSHIGQGSKVNHLTYIGDAEIGKKVNVGAGTITCNYDGHHKHKTVLDDGVFIGSGTQLVAPVHVHKNAVIGAGATITREVPEDTLAITRAPQKHVANWSKRQKKSSVPDK